ncbi:butyrophilin subfamily 1 member A1-like [Tachyglossus aculeatus]|uniref:butyrophilin subfamily 1 member A1-like n=1 Tax=Tachyglossus aculeatus TaxID=9261 RepID=UPI0018F773D0|nr:butyrophilin subfamily 1 member A1-like [Tachyglossus aculeatus]XP_038624272.1 butyrophilin subfamily 1 member A1-like [Tachyglossus aculeatus]
MELMGFLESALPSYLISHLLLLLLQLLPQTSAQFAVIGPAKPIVVQVGEDAELPCHLDPKMSAEDMEVRWLRATFSPAVYVYRDGQGHFEEQMEEYRERTELLNDTITDGNVAVKLSNIRLSDNGRYHCRFQNSQHVAKSALDLHVAAEGSDPNIRLEGQEDGGIRLECTSTGWHPEPKVQWKHSRGRNVTLRSIYQPRGTDGLFSVVTSVIIRDDSVRTVSCSIWNPYTGRKKEATIPIEASFFRTVSPSTVALAVILPLLVLLMAGAVYLLWERHSKKKKRENGWSELLSSKSTWRWTQSCMVDITLDPDTAHPKLILSEDQKSVNLGDTRQNLLPNNPERFDEEPWVLGQEGFNSGKHCWEVEVGKKRGWSLGICREDVKRKGTISVSPEEGFWVVGLCGDEYSAFTNPKTLLPLPNHPNRVRVCLDYEAGDVSFYSGTDGSHIYTFSCIVFSGTLRPFFHPRTEDQICLTIHPVSGGAERDPVFAPNPAPSQDALVTHQGAQPASDTGEEDPSPVPDDPLLPPQPSTEVPSAP